MFKRIKEQKWYPLAVALCIAVVLYVVLTHLGIIIGGIGTFLGYFKSLFVALLLAYIMNPLAKLLNRTLYKNVKNPKSGWSRSIALTVVIVLIILVLIMGMLIPQLISSATTLVENMDRYEASLIEFTDRFGLTERFNLDQMLEAPGGVLATLQNFITDNIDRTVNVGLSAGKGIVTWGIGFILAIYILASKESMKSGAKELMRKVIPEKHLEGVLKFLHKCDTILIRYIVFSLIDSVIIGVVNAIFMMITGMQYAGVVSVIVAAMNLIPTFGPLIGAVLGGFILLLVKPVHALIFILFTLVLQAIDGYVIKPKLFGSSLGVSGALILVFVIVLGKMFGVFGMLIAIPAAAILYFVFKEYILPPIEKRSEARKAEKAEKAEASEDAEEAE